MNGRLGFMQNLKEDLTTFIDIAEALILDEEQHPVTKVIPTNELYQTLDIALKDEPLEEEEMKALLKDVVLNTPKTSGKRFFNQLFGGRHGKGILGDLLAVMLNNSMYTYKVGGPQIGIEKEIVDKACQLVGYGENSNGTLPVGGSMSNYMAMVMARDAYHEDIRFKGVQSTMRAYTSTESHYSNAKNAAFCGIGRDNLKKISTNDRGEMSAAKLEEQIIKDKEAGLSPFFVNATGGTTVLGAFDPIEEISAVCKKHGLWLHVDGAYCGSLIFSSKYGYLLKGSELSDSFSFNAHKMLSVPLTCSVIVVKDKRHLNQSFSNDATYLYQTDGDEFNPGKTSFQCGRRNDALKFWTLWKSIGTKGLEQMVDHQFELANIARDVINQNPDYKLYSFDESMAICFNYKDIEPKALCTALYESGELMVGFGSFKEDTFVRLVTVNSSNTKEEIVNFFVLLEAFVAKNYDRLPKVAQHDLVGE
jgi:sulfinoalanine decarboxylase/sulfinoalanine decarboxylase/aspartate 1-decarboxylase